MVFVISAAVLCVAMGYALRKRTAGAAPISFVGFDGHGVIVAFVLFIAASSALGTIAGAALILSLLLHELGHVLAYRMLGHTETRFRMAPFLSMVPISDRKLGTESESFFVALMGPGFSLAPMVLAMTLSSFLASSHPDVAQVLRLFAVTCATVNFVNLLPFWPLDGGRCARIATGNFWPALAPGLTVFMSTAMFVAGIRTQSLALIIVALAGYASLMGRHDTSLEPMGADNGLIALSAYTFTLAAHFSAAWILLGAYF